MKYINAADVLPDKLLKTLQKYAEGEALYIPKVCHRKKWGEGSGAMRYYEQRNDEIRDGYKRQLTIDMLAEQYHLSIETIRKIVYSYC